MSKKIRIKTPYYAYKQSILITYYRYKYQKVTKETLKFKSLFNKISTQICQPKACRCIKIMKDSRETLITGTVRSFYVKNI